MSKYKHGQVKRDIWWGVWKRDHVRLSNRDFMLKHGFFWYWDSILGHGVCKYRTSYGVKTRCKKSRYKKLYQLQKGTTNLA